MLRHSLLRYAQLLTLGAVLEFFNCTQQLHCVQPSIVAPPFTDLLYTCAESLLIMPLYTFLPAFFTDRGSIDMKTHRPHSWLLWDTDERPFGPETCISYDPYPNLRELWRHRSFFTASQTFLSPLGTTATVLPIVPAPDDRWWMWSSRWNENWQGKPKYSEKTCHSASLSTTKPTWPDPGSIAGRRGGKPATNQPEL
jgi:hypothetical protein